MQENGELELDFLQNAMKFFKILHMCYKVPQFLVTNLMNIAGIDKLDWGVNSLDLGWEQTVVVDSLDWGWEVPTTSIYTTLNTNHDR